MLTIKYESTFKKDYKRVVKRKYNIQLMEPVIELLANRSPLPPKYKDHDLTGDCTGCRECHITQDWLLVYRINDEELILILTRTGTHSNLF